MCTITETYHQEQKDNREYLETLTRQLADGLIGGAWEMKVGNPDTEDARYVYLSGIVGNTTVRVHIALDWRNKARVVFNGSLPADMWEYRHRDFPLGDISCSRNKTAAQMAKDIERRLLPGLVDATNAALTRKASADAYKAKQQSIQARFEAAMPGQVKTIAWKNSAEFYAGSVSVYPFEDTFTVERLSLPADAVGDFAALLAKYKK